MAWLAACGVGADDRGTACERYEDCADYCIDEFCKTPHIGEPLTCGVFGDPDRYGGVDLSPMVHDCSLKSPCPLPYECVPLQSPGDDDASCLLPCNGQDCPEGYLCQGVDIQAYDIGVPCGYCITAPAYWPPEGSATGRMSDGPDSGPAAKSTAAPALPDRSR